MSEFVWTGEIGEFKIVTSEITRADQFSIWHDIQSLGLLELAENGSALEQNERLAELVTAKATRAIYEKSGDGWKSVNGKSAVQLPVTPDMLRALPMSLANGWIKAALQDNRDIYEVVNFPSASVRTMNAGSAPPSDSTP